MNTLDGIKSSQSESFKKNNPHIFGTDSHQMKTLVHTHPKFSPDGGEDDAEHEALTAKRKAKKKRIRQSDKPLLNKLESQFLHKLEKELPTALTKIYPQAIRLRLANGITYSPDFFVFHRNGSPWAYEVKGKHAWDDAIVKIKCAAAAYPYITFYMVWKDEHGQWQEQHVLP